MPDSCRKAMLIPDQSQTFSQATCEDTPNAISSVEFSDGRLPCNSPDGRQTDLFGLAPAHVKTTPPQESAKERTVTVTCGLHGLPSFESASLTQSLANRLQQRLDTVGSIEYAQTWKEKVTPSGQLYWAHTARQRPEKTESDYNYYNLWMTRLAHLSQINSGSGGNPAVWLLGLIMNQAHPTSGSECFGYATPSTRDHKDTGDLEKSKFRKDGKERNDTIPRQVAMAGYPSPTVANAIQGVYKLEKRQQDGSRQSVLNNVTALVDGITPKSADPQMDFGTITTCFLSSTEKRGVLNPAHSRWLMGYPVAWCQAAILASRTLKQRRKGA
jgi:hypothetical protein